MLKMTDIKDGSSKTYLVGEKGLNSDAYYNGNDPGDDQTLTTGDDLDANRWTAVSGPSGTLQPPLPDTPGAANWYGFGGPHAVGVNMAFCDGSVNTVRFSIDPRVHCYLGSRNDGVNLDGKQY